MRKFYTWFLRIIAILLGLGFLFIDGYLLPTSLYDLMRSDYELRLYLLFVLIVIFLVSIPFLMIFYNTIRFMNVIDRHEVYTLKSISILQSVRFCAFISTLILSIGAVFLYFVVDYEDTPGVLLIWLLWTVFSFVIGVIVSLIRQFILEEVKFEDN